MSIHNPGKSSIPKSSQPSTKVDLKPRDYIPGTKGAAYHPTPNMLTPERTEVICGWIRKGNRRATAARLSGISDQTMFNWMATGELDADSVCGKSREAVLQAEADHEQSLVERWAEINDKVNDYKGVESLLKHRHKWEPPATKTELTGANGGPITLGRADLEALSPEQLEQHLEIMETLAKARMKADMTLQITDGSEEQE